MKSNGNSLHQLGERLLECKLLHFLSLRCGQDHLVEEGDVVRDDGDHQESSILPTKYQNKDQYKTAWEALLVIEIREQLLKGFLDKTLRCERQLSWASVQANHLQLQAQIHFTLPSNLSTQFEQGLVNTLVEKEMMFYNFQATQTAPNSYVDMLGLPKLYDLLVISPDPLQLSALVKSFSSVESRSKALEDFESQGFMLGWVVYSPARHWGRRHQVLFSMNQWKHLAHIPTSTSSNSKGSLTSADFVQYQMYFQVLGNVGSRWQEYHALQEVNETQTPLLPAILSASLVSSQPNQGTINAGLISSMGDCERQLRTLRGVTSIYFQRLKAHCNFPQLQAITIATKVDPNPSFTLIQGPPGSGKSTIILHILNTLHVHQYHDLYEPLLQNCLSSRAAINVRTPDMQAADLVNPWINLICEHTQRKPRYLVLAASNAAIDQLALRIMQQQFRDSLGQRYSPKMVRIGDGGECHVDLKGIELQELLQDSLHGNFCLADKQAYVVELQVHMQQIVEQLVHLQAMLVNMHLAFHQYFPLPGPAWELRVDANTAIPYWVNHELRTTRRDPPVEEIQAWWKRQEKKREQYPQHDPQAAAKACRYPTIQTIPEYQIYSRKFIQTTQLLHELHLKEVRMNEIIDISHRDDIVDISQVPNRTKEVLETTLLSEAELVFATLTSCGQSSLESYDFDYIFVDDATQCTEPSLLMALQKSCRHCILVGDAQQWTPETYSVQAKRQGYDISLFERLWNARHSTSSLDHCVVLNQQYRMLPEIAAFPSQVCYGGNVKNGDLVEAAAYLPSYMSSPRFKVFHEQRKRKLLLPILFLDVKYGTELQHSQLPSADSITTTSSNSSAQDNHNQDDESKEFEPTTKSKYNPQEVDIVVQLLQIIRDQATLHQPQTASSSGAAASPSRVRVGIISPYRDQCREIQAMLESHIATLSEVLQIEVDTVDGFQGKEKDIVIMSAVRANTPGNVGLAGDVRGMNVALTRARFGLYIVGHASTLQHHHYWKSLLEHARKARAVIEVNHPKIDLVDLVTDRHNSIMTAEGSHTPPLVMEHNSSFDFNNIVFTGEGAGKSRKRKQSEMEDYEEIVEV